MLKAIQLPPSNYLKKYCQTLDAFTWQLRQEKSIKIQIFKKKLEKNCKFYQTISKSRKVKLLKTNPLKLKTMQ